MTVSSETPAQAAPARAGVGETVRSAVVDLFAVLLRAVQLLARHWPVLLAILFAGEAGRYAALWAAIELSDIHGTLGVLVLVLGPLAAVSALIAALYALRHSLPSLRAASDGGSGGTASGDGDRGSVGGPTGKGGGPGVLNVLASVMVPFLAIYASYGFLSEDVFRFVNAAVTDELFSVDALLGTEEIDVDRTALATGWVAMVVVLVALVLRYGLGVLGRRRRIPGLPWVAAYVEVLWLVTLARMLAAHQEAAIEWIQGRSVVRTVLDAWNSLVAAAGPVGEAVDTAVRWLFELLSSADALLVIPVAWLTVGAVVYGQQLREPERPAPKRRRPRGQLVGRVPAPVKQVGSQLTGGIANRFGALAAALRRLALAGLGPMLLFALAFVIAHRLEYAVDLAWRELLGPMPLGTYLAFAPHTGMVSHVIGTVAVVCLLGAAIDRVLGRGVRPAAADVTTP